MHDDGNRKSEIGNRKSCVCVCVRKTKRQRSVLRLLRAGAIIISNGSRYKLRLLDDQRNPISYVHRRTFNALYQKELIIKQKDGSYSAVQNI